MATIGSVTKRPDGRYEGELRTLSIRAEITILPVGDKSSPNQPDFRVLSQGIEIGGSIVNPRIEFGEFRGVALDFCSHPGNLARSLFAMRYRSFEFTPKARLLQVDAPQRVFEICVEVAKALGYADLGKHPLAHLVDLGFGVSQPAQVFQI